MQKSYTNISLPYIKYIHGKETYRSVSFVHIHLSNSFWRQKLEGHFSKHSDFIAMSSLYFPLVVYMYGIFYVTIEIIHFSAMRHHPPYVSLPILSFSCTLCHYSLSHPSILLILNHCLLIPACLIHFSVYVISFEIVSPILLNSIFL